MVDKDIVPLVSGCANPSESRLFVERYAVVSNSRKMALASKTQRRDRTVKVQRVNLACDLMHAERGRKRL